MTKETWLIGVCATRLVVCKPKVSMTSLCSTAAPNCHTGQSKGRYCMCARSILLILVGEYESPTKGREYVMCGWQLTTQGGRWSKLGKIWSTEFVNDPYQVLHCQEALSVYILVYLHCEKAHRICKQRRRCTKFMQNLFSLL